jgi:PAS domain-containing protein
VRADDSLLDDLPVGVAVFAADGTPRSANPALLEMLGADLGTWSGYAVDDSR